MLNINDLCLRGILSHCKMHHFGLRNSLFQELKSTISHCEMGLIGLRNRLYQKTKLTFPDYVMGYIKMRYCPKCHLLCMI